MGNLYSFDYIKFTVEGWRSKKNNQRMCYNRKTKRYFPLPSKKYSEWKEKGVEICEGVRDRYNGKLDFPIKKDTIVLFRFFHNRQRPDFDNACSGILDVLEEAEIFKNDKFVLPVPWFPNHMVKSKQRKVQVLIVLEDPAVIYPKLFQEI